MYCHPSSTGGPTVWDFAATPGAATEFIAKGSPSGKAARNLFKHGMRCLFQNKKASDSEASSEVITETSTSDNMASSEEITQTNTLDTMALSEDINEDPMVSSEAITKTLMTTSTPDQCPPTSSNFGLIAGEKNKSLQINAKFITIVDKCYTVYRIVISYMLMLKCRP